MNRGIGADVTFGLRTRLDDVTRRKPSKLFVLIGINDISKDIPDAVIAAEYRMLIDSVRAQSPQTKIFVQSILPLNPTVKNFPQHYDKQPRVVAVNRLLQQMARETHATYIDLWPIFIDRQNHLDASLTGDGLHLNQAGLRALGRVPEAEGIPVAGMGGCHPERAPRVEGSVLGFLAETRTTAEARGTAFRAEIAVAAHGFHPRLQNLYGPAENLYAVRGIRPFPGKSG